MSIGVVGAAAGAGAGIAGVIGIPGTAGAGTTPTITARTTTPGAAAGGGHGDTAATGTDERGRVTVTRVTVTRPGLPISTLCEDGSLIDNGELRACPRNPGFGSRHSGPKGADGIAPVIAVQPAIAFPSNRTFRLRPDRLPWTQTGVCALACKAKRSRLNSLFAAGRAVRENRVGHR